MTDLRIGEVAKAVGVPVQTVRYYERRGLCPPEGRTPSGYRRYTEATVARLSFIRHAKELGFTLREIGELLDLRLHSEDACARVEQRVEEKVALVTRRIKDLTRLRRTLEGMAESCRKQELTRECPILEALEHHEG
jgi:Hg(II)-responsive transcriptional regulator